MLNQNVLGEKFQDVRNKFRRLFQKAKSIKRNPERTEDYEFEPESDRVGTAPRILASGTSNAQNLVWDNEDASMQDKSYSFDESTTDADYDTEDDLNFSDDDGNQDGR